jgi:hypothetical protein
MDIIQVSGTWGLGSIPGEGTSSFSNKGIVNLTSPISILYYGDVVTKEADEYVSRKRTS